MPASILIVDDEPVIRELVGSNLSNAGHQVRKAGDAEAAQRLMNEILPDLILVDWRLPGMNGLEFARRLRANQRTKSLPFIMFSASGNENDMVAALEAGADDFITKPFSPREMVARVRAVMRRRAPHTTHEVVEVAGLRLDPVSRRISADGNWVHLGPIEFRILHFLMTHPDTIHSRVRLLDRIWGESVFIEERTVDVHIRRLRISLEPFGLDALIQTVRGNGYRLSGTG